jgi:hypothetical protein
MYRYSWLNYYGEDDEVIGDRSFGRESISLCANDYIKESSPINVKNRIKNKDLLDVSKIGVWQLRAFYYWKKSNYPKKDVFEGFIPDESDIKLLRDGGLTADFYSFRTTIPTILIK